MLLCDAAQEVGGKLYIIGGGWSIKGLEPAPMAVALKIDVPWQQANQSHRFSLVLEDADGRAVEFASPEGRQEVRIEGNFEVGRPPGIPVGSDIDASLAVNIGPLPLEAGRYSWQLSIDGDAPEEWRRTFTVRAR